MQKKYFFVVLLLLLYLEGCSISEQQFILDSYPQILEKTSLPPINQFYKGQFFKIEARMLVSEDGSVLKARLFTTSKDNDWDSLVVEQLKKWKFTPAYFQGKPITIWVKQTIQVMVSEAYLFPLSEIVCISKEQADSVYNRIKNGADFNLMVSEYSISNSKANNGFLGKVDIYKYPKNIQLEIINLKANEISKPVEISNKYYIFRNKSE